MKACRSLLLLLPLCMVAGAARAEGAPPATDQDKLTQAVESAAAAAKSAKEAAEASQKVVESLSSAAPKPAAAPAEAPKAPEAPPPGPAPWSFQIAANLQSVTGNATSVTGKLSGRVEGHWEDWAALFKADAAYGQAEPKDNGETTVTALNASASARGDRKISGIFSAYLVGGAMTDHVASIEYQAFGEAGVGIVWLETKQDDYFKSRIRTDLGFRYTRESDFRYYPTAEKLGDKDIFAPRVAASFLYALTKTSVITEDLEVLPDIIAPSNLRVSSNTALAAELFKGVALQVGFKVRYIGVPAAGAKTTDTELGLGVIWNF